MKTYEETFERVMAERDSYMRRKKERTKFITTGSVVLAGVALAVISAFGLRDRLQPSAYDAQSEAAVESINSDYDEYTAPDLLTQEIATIYTPEGYTAVSEETAEAGEAKSAQAAQITAESGTTKAETATVSQNDGNANATVTRSATKKSASTTAATAEMAATERNWNDRTLPGQFNSVTVDGREYMYPFNTNETRTTKRNGTKTVSAMKIKGYEPGGKEHTTTADIYTLSGFDKKFVIGVKLNGDSNIYPYINSFYQPATLGEFISGVDYNNTVSYGNITLYKGTSFPVNSQNKADIKKYLLSDMNTKIDVNSDWAKGNYVTLSINLEELGIYNKSFRVYESGYVQTNLVGYAYLFYVGKDNVANFLENSYNITFDQIREINNNAKTTTAVVSDPTYPVTTSKPHYVTETTKR